jgi:hypothetical protein
MKMRSSLALFTLALIVLGCIGCTTELPFTGTSCAITADCRRTYGADSFCVKPGPINFGLPSTVVIPDGLCYDMPTQHTCVETNESYVPVISLSGIEGCTKDNYKHVFYDACVDLSAEGTGDAIQVQNAAFTDECGPDLYSGATLGYLAR